jgi:hypothetical protein
METEKYSPELVTKYLNQLKKEYPDKDSHFLEVAVIQYLLLDCEKVDEPNENINFIKARQQNAQTDFNSVLFEGQYKPYENDNNFEDKKI